MLVRKRVYDINNYKTKEERHSHFAIEKKKIDKILEEGYHIDRTKDQDTNVFVNSSVSLSDALLDVLKIKRPSMRPGSVNSYNSTVRIFLKWAEKNNMAERAVFFFDQIHAQMFIDYLLVEKKLKGKTINDGYLSQLKSLFSELVKRTIIEKNPFSNIKKVKVEDSARNRAFDEEEVQKLKKMIFKEDKQLWLFISMIYYCFIRPNELRQLRVEDIDLDSNLIRISGSITKSRKNSSVTIPGELKKILLDSIDFLDRKRFIFPGISNKPISKNVMTRRHKKYLKRLHLDDDYTLYSWKHTGVVNAYNAGIKIKSIQRQCRHASIEQTDNYLKSLNLYENEDFLMKMPKI